MSSKQEKVRKEILCKILENPSAGYKKVARDVGTSIITVKRVMSRYKNGLSTQRKSGSGGKKGPRDKKLAKTIAQKFNQKPNTSVRDMAKKTGASKSFVQKVKKYYNLHTYKVQKVPDRSEEKNKVAKRRARQLYTQYLTKFDCVVMDDETYCKADFNQLPGKEFYTAFKRGGVSNKFKQKKVSKFPKQYMVWQAICTCGRRSQDVVVKGSINSKVYIEKCLEGPLKALIRQHQGSVLFWPDLATSHYARSTLQWYDANNINYVPKEANPPNCPELRPIEKYWALMKRSLKNTKKVSQNERDFQNKWRRAYRVVDENTVQNLMNGVKKKVRAFYQNP